MLKTVIASLLVGTTFALPQGIREAAKKKVPPLMARPLRG